MITLQGYITTLSCEIDMWLELDSRKRSFVFQRAQILIAMMRIQLFSLNLRMNKKVNWAL